MYAIRKRRQPRLGRMGRTSALRGLGDDSSGFDSTSFFTNLVNDAAKVAAVAVQPTTSINSSVSPTGVQSYSYSAPAGSTATGVASLTSSGSSGWLLLAAAGIVAVMLLRR